MTKTKWIILIAIIVVVIIAAILLIWWFTSREDIKIPFVTKTPEELMKEEVESAVEEYDFSQFDFDTVDKIKTLEKKGIPIVDELISSSDKKERYLGYIAISGLMLEDSQKKAELMPKLMQGLTDQDSTIKVQVAQLVLNLGDLDGFPVLINALDSEEIMVPSEPIMRLAEYAYLILIEYTNQDYGYDKVKWQNWWDANKDSFEWDETVQKFK